MKIKNIVLKSLFGVPCWGHPELAACLSVRGSGVTGSSADIVGDIQLDRIRHRVQAAFRQHHREQQNSYLDGEILVAPCFDLGVQFS